MTAMFTCPECQVVFTRSAHLRRHQRTHRAEKPYNCALCGVVSSRKDVIVRHTRNFHPEAVQGKTAPAANSTTSAATEATTAATQTIAATATTVVASTAVAATVTSPTTERVPDSSWPQQAQQAQEPTPQAPSPGVRARASTVSTSSTSRSPRSPAPSLQSAQFQDWANLGLASPHPFAPMDTMPGMSLDYPTDFDLFEFLVPATSTDASLDSTLAPLTPLPTDTSTNPHFSISAHDDYSLARANIQLFGIYQSCTPFTFPSKTAANRFVNAFSTHMAKHVPIVHMPTFSTSTVASPLLIEVMACGALYLCERTTAIRLHAAASQLMCQFEHSGRDEIDDTFNLWTLQTYLLMSYFDAYSSTAYAQRRVTSAFSHVIKLSRTAIKNISKAPALTYRDWVCQETLNRCIALTIKIGAALASTSSDHCFTAFATDVSFVLPSDEKLWCLLEADWTPPLQPPDNLQVLNCIMSGQKPLAPISVLGLVTTVSSVLWRVCLLEVSESSQDLSSQLDLINKLERAMQILDTIFEDQSSDGEWTYVSRSPLFISGKALLDSTFYHLYGSKTLSNLKRQLENPGIPNSGFEVTTDCLEGVRSSKLHKALLRAAKALNTDCQSGVNYIQKMAPYSMGPTCATSCYEAGLLLHWYLRSRDTLQPTLDYAKLDQLVEESLVETMGLPGMEICCGPALPLLVSAELLSDGSVWQWPIAVSRKLKSLTNSLSGMVFSTDIQV